MLQAFLELDWSYRQIGGMFDRDPRQVRRHLENMQQAEKTEKQPAVEEDKVQLAHGERGIELSLADQEQLKRHQKAIIQLAQRLRNEVHELVYRLRIRPGHPLVKVSSASGQHVFSDMKGPWDQWTLEDRIRENEEAFSEALKSKKLQLMYSLETEEVG